MATISKISRPFLTPPLKITSINHDPATGFSNSRLDLLRKPLILPVIPLLFHFHILRNQICLSSNLPHLPTIRPHSFTNFRNRPSRQLSTSPVNYLKNLIRRQNSVVKGDFAILVVNGVMKSKTVLAKYPCRDIKKKKTD